MPVIPERAQRSRRTCGCFLPSCAGPPLSSRRERRKIAQDKRSAVLGCCPITTMRPVGALRNAPFRALFIRSATQNMSATLSAAHKNACHPQRAKRVEGPVVVFAVIYRPAVSSRREEGKIAQGRGPHELVFVRGWQNGAQRNPGKTLQQEESAPGGRRDRIGCVLVLGSVVCIARFAVSAGNVLLRAPIS